VDIRIGVTDHPREIGVTLPEGADRAAIKAEVEAALAGTSPTLWLSDEKGGEIGVAAGKIAFVEIGPEVGSPIGFG